MQSTKSKLGTKKGCGKRKNNSSPLAYSVPDLAEELGIGVNATYDALKAGTIPCIRMHRKYIIPKTAIAEWLKSVRPRSASPSQTA